MIAPVTTATPETLIVLTPEPLHVRLAPVFILGDPVRGVHYPPVPAADRLLQIMLSGIPTELAAGAIGFPLDQAQKIAAQYGVGTNETGLFFARIAGEYTCGRTKAQLERKWGVTTQKVTDALYFYRLENPPGRGADPEWRGEVARQCINGWALHEILASCPSCTEAELRAALLYEGVLLSAIPSIAIEKQRACDVLYPQYSSDKIAAIVAISAPTVLKILHRFDRIIFGARRYATLHYNEDAFLGYAPETLYWLGFAFAEGHAQNKYKFTIRIARDDMQHLVRYCEYLGTNNYPRDGVNEIRAKYPGRLYKNSYVDVCCAAVVANLLSRGFATGERYKTMREVVIEKAMGESCHFLRGYFDGNGGIAVDRHQINIRCPLKCVCDVFTAWLDKNAPGITTWSEVGKCWSLQLSTRRAQALINFLYFDGSGAPYEPALARKIAQAEKFRALTFAEPQFGREDIADILARRAAGEGGASVARHYGCSQALISNIWNGHQYKEIIADLRREIPVPTAAR